MPNRNLELYSSGVLDVRATIRKHEAWDLGADLDAKVDELEFGVNRVRSSSLGEDSGGGLGGGWVRSHSVV